MSRSRGSRSVEVTDQIVRDAAQAGCSHPKLAARVRGAPPREQHQPARPNRRASGWVRWARWRPTAPRSTLVARSAAWRAQNTGRRCAARHRWPTDQEPRPSRRTHTSGLPRPRRCIPLSYTFAGIPRGEANPDSAWFDVGSPCGLPQASPATVGSPRGRRASRGVARPPRPRSTRRHESARSAVTARSSGPPPRPGRL